MWQIKADHIEIRSLNEELTFMNLDKPDLIVELKGS